MDSFAQAAAYLPFITTAISLFFARNIFQRYVAKPGASHLLWWGIGVVTFAAGTAIESLHAVFGWHVVLFKSWYIAGALLGGAPLAVGTVYLLLGKRAGHISAILLLAVVAVTSVFVVLSPIKYELVEMHDLSSKVLGWQKIRLVSPFVNGFAVLFLVGGAIYSAFKFAGVEGSGNVAVGNGLIAFGAILPGVGGMMSRLGHTEWLFVGELIGITLIWLGYYNCRKVPVLKESSVALPSEA